MLWESWARFTMGLVSEAAGKWIYTVAVYVLCYYCVLRPQRTQYCAVYLAVLGAQSQTQLAGQLQPPEETPMYALVPGCISDSQGASRETGTSGVMAKPSGVFDWVFGWTWQSTNNISIIGAGMIIAYYGAISH